MICDHTDVEQWRYVPSEINPADYASRGTTEKQFTEAKDWLKGPKFLWDSERNFQSENVSATQGTLFWPVNQINEALPRELRSFHASAPGAGCKSTAEGETHCQSEEDKARNISLWKG